MSVLNINIRLRIIIYIVLIISLLLITRIIYLSTTKIEDYQIVEKGEYSVKRGNVYDINGNLLAVSDLLKSVYINPLEIKDKDEVANQLSSILNINKKSIIEKINSQRKFFWIKRLISPSQSEKIVAQNLRGVYLKDEYKRFYPNKNLCSHILGFCNIDNRGVEGIEKSMDSFLLSEVGNENSNKYKGLNVKLTIDSNIQAIAELSLKNGAIRENSDLASLIFIDGISGEIIAMANYPDFDPNIFNEYKQESFRNTSIFYQFEPGSVFKIFSLSPLIDNRYINQSTYFFCNGIYEKDGLKVKCTGNHGTINFSGIMKYSCNDATLQASEKLSSKELYGYLKSFGFGESSTILLPGEQPGLFRDISNWSKSSRLSIPIGQEISVNALQLVRASTVFVNDGVMVEPYIIKNILDDNKNIMKEYSRKEIRRVLNKGVSRDILNAMTEATMDGGTARVLKIEGIQFAAKSGTAQIFDTKLKKYSDTDVTSSLIVVFPFEKPRYIIYMVFHNPKGENRWGGYICSKLLVEFITGIIGYTHLGNEDEFLISSEDISVGKEYEKIKSFPFDMPNLIGLSAGDALQIFSYLNVDIKVYGNGTIYRQTPDFGEEINKTDKIELYLK